MVGDAWLLPFPLFFSCVLPAGTHTLALIHTLTRQGDKCAVKCFPTRASFSLAERLSLGMLVVTPTLRPVCFGSEETPPQHKCELDKEKVTRVFFMNCIANRRRVRSEKRDFLFLRSIITRLLLSASLFYSLALPNSSEVAEGQWE